jgi:O-antigen/teichoic acid export membrane protein
MLFAFALVNGWLTAVLVARRAFSRVNRASLIAGALPAIVYSIALAAVGRSEQPAPSTVTFVLSVMVLVETFRCVGLSLGVRQVEEATSSHEAPRLRALLTYSLLAFAADTIQYFTYRADLWIMKAARPDAELGQYSLAVTLAELTLLAAAAFATVLLPHVPTVSPVEAVKTTARVATATLIATTAIAAIGFALAVPLLPVIFTRAFEPSVSLLGVLLLGVVPMSVAKILGNYFAGSGQLKVCLMAAIAGMVVCVTGDVLTIPTYGAMAAAACTAIAYGVFTLFLIVAFLRRSPVPFVQLIDAVRNRRASSAA